MKNKRDPAEYDKKLKELAQLLALEKQGFLKVYFADESGFNLNPCVPYGWQEKGKYIPLPAQSGGNINVFGLIARDNDFHPYICEQNIYADFAIAFMNDFAKNITQRTVAVLDNSPVHRSQAFMNRIEAWKEQDLYVFFLPKYSPHLNLIEILWRKIKYEWLKPQHYRNKETFSQALENILVKIGDEFTINFKKQKVPIIFQ